MKAFGIRLAFGAVTILCGAYAAALAQRDKPDSDPATWSPTVATTGEVAQPLGGSQANQPLGGSQVNPPLATFGGDAQTMLPLDGQTFNDDAVASATGDSDNGSGMILMTSHEMPSGDDGESGSTGGFKAAMMTLPDAANGDEANAGEVSIDGGNVGNEVSGPTGFATPTFGEVGSSDPASDSAVLSQPAISQPAVSQPPEASWMNEVTTPAPETSGAELAESSIAEPAALQTETSDAATMQLPGFRTPIAGTPTTETPPTETPTADTLTTPALDGAGEMSIPQLPAGDPLPPTGMMQVPAVNSLREAPSPSPSTRDPANAYPADAANAFPGDSANAYPGDAAAYQGIQQPLRPAGAVPMAQAPTLSATPANRRPLPRPARGNTPTGRFAASRGESSGALGGNPAAFGNPAAAMGGNPTGMQAQPLPGNFAGGQPGMEVNPEDLLAGPGDRRLEGAQTPALSIKKQAPPEVKVGQPASFVIDIRNVGSVEAMDVKVHDRIPAGMRLQDATPTPDMVQGDLLLWNLGALPAGDRRSITMQLVPEAEGELGSVARVTFESAASVRTISTRPELKIVQRAPPKVMIGGVVEIDLEVSNPGTGEATGVVLQEDVPEQLEHPKGRRLDNKIGNLAAGEVRQQVLRMRAVKPGIVENLIRLESEDGLVAEHVVKFEVVAPKVDLAVAGPSVRYLERQAEYKIAVANSGTAEATNVKIAMQLAGGLKFVSADKQGQYDSQRHIVFWSLPLLPAGIHDEISLTVLPVQIGSQAMRADARADLNQQATRELALNVEGFAELDFEIVNPGGPVEVGRQTDYEIRVKNSGTAPDQNVVVQLVLPQGLEFLEGDNNAKFHQGRIVFEPQAQMAPGSELVYRARARAIAPGTHIVKAALVSDQLQRAVTKEESTRAYADR